VHEINREGGVPIGTPISTQTNAGMRVTRPLEQ
jgi:hypothetical protein